MGVDTHQLVAGEGAHLDLLAVECVGRQLGGGVVVAPLFLGHVGIPGAADGSADSAVLNAGNDVGIGGTDKSAVGRNVHDGLGHIGAGFLVPVADGVDAIFGQGGLQAGTGKEAVNVPAVVGGHIKGAAGGSSGGQDAVHRLGIFRADDTAVIVQEVAVVGGHGIGVELAIEGGSFHRAFQVAALHIVGVEGNFLQGTGGHQLVELVIGKGENIRSGGGIGQDIVLGIGLGAGTDVDGDIALVFVFFNKSISHLAQHGLIFLCAPHGQRYIAPAGGRLGGGITGGGSFSGRSALASAASGQRQRHGSSHSQAQLLFHVIFSFGSKHGAPRFDLLLRQYSAIHCTIYYTEGRFFLQYIIFTVFFCGFCATCVNIARFFRCKRATLRFAFFSFLLRGKEFCLCTKKAARRSAAGSLQNCLNEF